MANREEGTVSVFAIRGQTVTPAGMVAIAGARSGVSHVAFTPDGKMALVTRDGDDRISVLSVDGARVDYTGRDMFAGIRPYGIDVAGHGGFAAVANIGRGSGDHDTISLIDLRARPPRVVETVTVGPTPEGIKVSPDGSVVAVAIMNGSNLPKASPFYHDHGKLVLYRVSGTSLAKVAEAPIGDWSQGVAFSADGRTILVGNMVERDVQVFALERRRAERDRPDPGTAVARRPSGRRSRSEALQPVGRQVRQEGRGALRDQVGGDRPQRGRGLEPDPAAADREVEAGHGRHFPDDGQRIGRQRIEPGPPAGDAQAGGVPVARGQ